MLPARSRSRLFRIAHAVLLAGLAWFYLHAATVHASHVNTIKSRGDQTGYLVDAERVYANWHGQSPPFLIGERMRMPVYAGVLALAYSPAISDDAFFLLAKRLNIVLSLGLLVVIGVLFHRFLPPHAALNLTLVVAFGYFVFKAGYAQPELLFYTLFFVTFLLACLLLEEREQRRRLALAFGAGLLAGVTHLTKAVMPPFLGVYGAVYTLQEAWLWRTDMAARTWEAGRRLSRVAARLLPLAVLLAAFGVVVGPYVATSKRVFGSYFFNANTTYYIWYDTGAQARALLLPHTDANGVIDIPADLLPSMSTYLRTRRPAQILQRFTDGAWDMVERSYRTYWYFPYLLLYLGASAWVLAADGEARRALLTRHWALLLFLVLYAAVFLVSTAFFSTISGTGTSRFLIAHLTPLFFALAWFLARLPIRTWSVGRAQIGVWHFQALVSALLTWDLLFTIWPRLMTTYGGF